MKLLYETLVVKNKCCKDFVTKKINYIIPELNLKKIGNVCVLFSLL